MSLKIFDQQDKIEEERSLEVVVSAESLRDKRIADLIAFGKAFYSEKNDGKGRYVGVPDALRQALTYAGTDGFVASMPEFIAAKLKVGKDHAFWNNWYTLLSEEDIGVDKKGLWVRKNEPVLVVLHGGGILTPDRIEQAYKEGLVDGSAGYSKSEFGGLLEGNLPDGNSVKLYSLDDLKRGVKVLEHRFGVVMPYELAQATESGWYNKKEFMDNPLVIARVVDMENLEKYFNKAKGSDGTLGNWHTFKNRRASTPQGRLLFLNYYYGDLYGDYDLGDDARCVGVSAGGA